MNTRTGELLTLEERTQIIDECDAALCDFIAVEQSEMTKKQRQTHQVSLHDRRSTLGRKLTVHRRKNYNTRRR